MPSTINADNGVVSGSAGLKSAADSSGVLQLQTNGTTAVTVDTSQNVGVGTASPAYKLDVTGQARATTGFAVSTDGSTFTPSGLNAIPNYGTGYITSTSRVALSGFGGLSFYTNQALSMLVDQSGNVGIGTSSPGARLHVDSGTSGDQIRISNGAGPTVYYKFGRNTGTGYLDFYGSQSGFTGYVFGGVDGERMRIDSSGNLLVGTASGVGRLRVISAGATSATYAIASQNSSSTDLFAVRSDGAFFTGTAAVSPYNNTTGTAVNMVVGSDGSLYRSTSSLRYKTNVQDATYGLADVLKLRPVTYQGKNDGDTVFGGLIAEEVHEAGLTQFVTYDSQGRPDALAYGNMVSLLIAAVKELKAEVDSLKSQLAAKG